MQENHQNAKEGAFTTDSYCSYALTKEFRNYVKYVIEFVKGISFATVQACMQEPLFKRYGFQCKVSRKISLLGNILSICSSRGH